ncbi:MAG: DUF2190 family protein [Planktomarina sp.]
MNNYIQKGDALTFTAQDDVHAGQGVVQGEFFGVASTDAATGQDFEAFLVGVYNLTRATDDPAADTGDLAYWDVQNSAVTTKENGTKAIGAITQPAPAGSVTIEVRLNGVA